jgi:hypothetical protein
MSVCQRLLCGRGVAADRTGSGGRCHGSGCSVAGLSVTAEELVRSQFNPLEVYDGSYPETENGHWFLVSVHLDNLLKPIAVSLRTTKV